MFTKEPSRKAHAKSSQEAFKKSSYYVQALRKAYPNNAEHIAQDYTIKALKGVCNQMFTVNYNDHTA